MSTGRIWLKVGTIEYQLLANVPRVEIGWILLGSMRVERDLQYSGRHLQAFGAPTFRLPEQEELIANLARLDPAERERQLRLLHALISGASETTRDPARPRGNEHAGQAEALL